MANEKNLIPLTERSKEDAKRIRQMGAEAAGAARRRKRSLREAADLFFSLPVADQKAWNKIAKSGVDPEDIDNQMAVIIGLTTKAVKGDAKAAKLLFDLLGEQPQEQPKQDRQALADLLLHPAENRNIKDFEE